MTHALRPWYREMSFDDVVKAAKEKCSLCEVKNYPFNISDQIIEFRLHPDGLWTVRWAFIDSNGAWLMDEKPLNIEKSDL